MKTYVIGDIHGQLEMLKAAHARIAADRDRTGDTTSPVIHLGDLTDRGPDSRGVIDFLIKGRDDGHGWPVIKGNHDRMFTGFMQDPHHHDPGLTPSLEWLHPRLGGNTTLASYGVEMPDVSDPVSAHHQARTKVPDHHIAFLTNLPLLMERGPCLYVHAGIRPGVAIGDQIEDDLLWIRKPFLDDTRDHGALIVHGHTALEAPQHYGNRVNLDSGAGYGRQLTAAVIEGRDVFVLTQDGRRPLTPDTPDLF